MLLKELLQRDGHLLLHHAGVVDVAAQGEQLHTVVVLAAQTVEPVGTATENAGRHRHCLAVRDRRGTAVQTRIRGEWGLQTGLALLALQGLQLGGLFTAHVRTGAAVNKHIEVVTTSTGVTAEEANHHRREKKLPLLVRLVNGLFQTNALVVELTTNVNIGSTRMHGVTGNQTTLHQCVGVLTNNFSILQVTIANERYLAGSRLGFIAIHNEEIGTTILGDFGHERPL